MSTILSRTTQLINKTHKDGVGVPKIVSSIWRRYLCLSFENENGILMNNELWS